MAIGSLPIGITIPGDIDMLNEVRALIRVAIAGAARDLKALKPWMRLSRADREAQPRPETRFDLAATKQQATLLCMLMAHSRGRLHRREVYGDLPAQADELAQWLDYLDAGKGLPLLDGNIRAAGRVILALRTTKPTDQTTEHACVAPTVEHRA